MKKNILVCLVSLLIFTACNRQGAGELDLDKTYDVSVQDYIIRDGEKEIFGTIYKPKEEGVYPAIIMSHGYNGSNTDFYKEGIYYAEHGFIAYSFDFCGGSVRSRSSGNTTDMTIFTEKEDLQDVLDHFRTMDQVDRKRIFLMGGSQGGLVTSLAAEDNLRSVKGIVLYFPALGIPDNWNSRFPSEEDIPETLEFWGLRLGKVFFSSMQGFKTFENIGDFKENVLIIQGDSDSIVSMADSRRAEEIYPKAEMVVLPGEGHGFSPAGAKTAMELTLDFMRTHYR